MPFNKLRGGFVYFFTDTESEDPGAPTHPSAGRTTATADMSARVVLTHVLTAQAHWRQFTSNPCASRWVRKLDRRSTASMEGA